MIQSKLTHGTQAQNYEISEPKGVGEESLCQLIQLIEKQANIYQQAGLTHVTCWLD